MNIWSFIIEGIKHHKKMVLLYVLDSRGSSPGRRGFVMAVDEDGIFQGTIGGGIMEHKLLEWAKDLLAKGEDGIILKKQFHDKSYQKDQSGMICSGEQTVALVPLNENNLEQILFLEQQIKDNLPFCIQLNSSRFNISENKELSSPVFHFKNEKEWKFEEVINEKPLVHVFGGGHVGLALSQVLSLLEFHVIIYDDRNNLNTMDSNIFAHQKKIISYKNILEQIEIQENDYVVLVTFSYRSDKLLLEQLYDKKYNYIGMMGSEGKIKNLWEELENQGISKEEIAHVHAPIGMPIYSKTTHEIAVSIAGEIIKIKNKNLPHGRSY